MAEPDKLPEWSTNEGATIIEPPAPMKQNGWGAVFVAYQHINWIFNNIYKWLLHLRDDIKPTISGLAVTVGGLVTNVAALLELFPNDVFYDADALRTEGIAVFRKPDNSIVSYTSAFLQSNSHLRISRVGKRVTMSFMIATDDYVPDSATIKDIILNLPAAYLPAETPMEFLSFYTRIETIERHDGEVILSPFAVDYVNEAYKMRPIIRKTSMTANLDTGVVTRNFQSNIETGESHLIKVGTTISWISR